MKHHLIILVFLFVLSFISCQKKVITDTGSISGEWVSSAATLAERIYTLKHTGKYSDTMAAARNGGGIVFGGNSLIERMLYSNWTLTWQGYPVINRAIGGTTWAEQIPYIDSLFTCYKPKVIVLYHGENEYLRYPVGSYKEVSKTFYPNFLRFYDTLRKHNPQARIILHSMLAGPELFKRGYDIYQTSTGTIYDIDNLNSIYRNKIHTDSSATHVMNRYLNIKTMYQLWMPKRWYDSTKFDLDGVHVKLTKYADWYAKLKPVVDTLYKAPATTTPTPTPTPTQPKGPKKRR